MIAEAGLSAQLKASMVATRRTEMTMGVSKRAPRDRRRRLSTLMNHGYVFAEVLMAKQAAAEDRKPPFPCRRLRSGETGGADAGASAEIFA